MSECMYLLCLLCSNDSNKVVFFSWWVFKCHKGVVEHAFNNGFISYHLELLWSLKAKDSKRKKNGYVCLYMNSLQEIYTEQEYRKNPNVIFILCFNCMAVKMFVLPFACTYIHTYVHSLAEQAVKCHRNKMMKIESMCTYNQLYKNDVTASYIVLVLRNNLLIKSVYK